MNSYVGTNIGCKPYLAPERINPVRMDDPYDQRSDVWSYGITIVSQYTLHSTCMVYPHCRTSINRAISRIIISMFMLFSVTTQQYFQHRDLGYGML